MSEKRAKQIEVFETNQSDKAPQVEVRPSSVESSQEQSKQTEELVSARAEVARQSAEESGSKDKLLENLKAESEPAAEDDVSARPVGGELKKITFQKEIKHIRQKLGPVERLGSKIIHQPAIKNLSEVSSKTITRPSGLLGGGLVAFLGSSVYLYLTRHFELKYNYSIFLFLLVAGFVLGLVIEALLRLARGKRSA